MAVARQHRPALQLLYHARGQSLLAQRFIRPDAFDLCGMFVEGLVRTGGDDLAIALQDDKQPLRRQVPLCQLDFRIL